MLTHPERANHENPGPELFMNVIGSQRAPQAGGAFGVAVYLHWSSGGFDLSAHWVGYAYSSYGDASAFVPE
jgi:hypothetical protein